MQAMAFPEGLSPGLLEELKKHQIVFVRGKDELRKVREGMPHSIGILNAESAIDFMLLLWKGSTRWEQLQGARVLDIGSGSAFSPDILPPFRRYPHFARICAINGAIVTAIDKYPQLDFDKTLFTATEMNIVPPVLEGTFSQVPELQSAQFDMIQAEALVGQNPDPMLFEGQDHPKIFELQIKDFVGKNKYVRVLGAKEFTELLKRQCAPLLAEDGVLYLGERDTSSYRLKYYVMQQGQLVTKTK